MSTLGLRIRRARERHRMTQQQLAEAIGRSVRAVSDWERDKTVPRSAIGALEDVLGVSLDDDQTPDLPPDASLADIWDDLDPEMRDAMRRIVAWRRRRSG